MVSAHGLVPLHAPDQPAKNEPLLAAAVRVTTVPELNEAAHAGEQLIPAGLLVTTPLPVPANCTDSWKEVAAGEDAARSEACDPLSIPIAPLAGTSPASKLAAVNRKHQRLNEH